VSYDARLAGMGRDELVAEIQRLAGENDRIRRERDAYLENLTRTQERCTELLLEVRMHRRERQEADEKRKRREADEPGAGGSS